MCPYTHDLDVAEELGTSQRLTRLQAKKKVKGKRSPSPKVQRPKLPKKKSELVLFVTFFDLAFVVMP